MKLLNCAVIIIILLLGVSIANASTMEQWFDKNGWILGEEYDHYPSDNEIMKMMVSLSEVIEKNINRPVLWYAKGVLVSLKHGNYYDRTYPSRYDPNSSESQTLVKKYQSYYRKALELDDNPSAPDHLTIDMLANISDDVLADPDIKAKALQKEMELSQSGGYVSENPNYIWETYEVMLENYIQHQDYDNYLKTVNEMIERFPQSSQMDSLLEAKQQALEAIAQRDRVAATQDAYAQVDTYVHPKAAAVLKPVKAVEPKKAGAPKATNEAPASDNNTMLWWLLGGGVVLLGLTGLLRRRNKG